MTIALVSAVSARGNVNGFTSGAIDTSGASLLLVYVASYSEAVAPALTDSKSNDANYVGLTQQTVGASVRGRLWYCANPVVGSGHTFTLTGSGTYCSLAAAAFSGAHASPYDSVENGATVLTSATLQPGSVTPSEDNCLIATGAAWYSADGTPTSLDLSFTVAADVRAELAVDVGAALGYLIETTAAAKNPTWTLAASTFGIVAGSAVFKAAAASGYVPSRLHMSGGALPMTGGLFQ